MLGIGYATNKYRLADFSGVRASFQLACFTFIKLDRSGENNGI
jgi:hypothetical protein